MYYFLTVPTKGKKSKIHSTHIVLIVYFMLLCNLSKLISSKLVTGNQQDKNVNQKFSNDDITSDLTR